MSNELSSEMNAVLDELIVQTLEEFKVRHPELNDDQLFELVEKTVLELLLN